MKNFKYLVKRIWNRKINSALVVIFKPFFKNRELKDIIVIESHTNFDCNGGALYNYLITNNYNKKYLIVWRIKDRFKKRDLPQNVVTVREEGPSLRKVYYILNAKYFFSDNTMIKKPRNNQISVYCTHGGCTFKNVKGFLNVIDSVDYVLSSSKNYDPIMCENYSIPFPNNRMLHFGFPMNDVLFNKNVRELDKLPIGSFDKTILWMPTFRNAIFGRNDSKEDYPFGVPFLKSVESLMEMDGFLKELHIQLIIKLHPYQKVEFDLKKLQFSNIIFITQKLVVEKGIDVYKLMASADAMISDYSSAAYSFILLDRPLAFILSDIENYDRKFNIYDDIIKKFICGEVIYNEEELKSFFYNVLHGVDKQKKERNELLEWMYEYKDGRSCERIINFLNL